MKINTVLEWIEDTLGFPFWICLCFVCFAGEVGGLLCVVLALIMTWYTISYSGEDDA